MSSPCWRTGFPYDDDDVVKMDEILRRTIRILANPKHYARGTYLARNHKGQEVSALDPDAVQWSIAGAVRKAAQELGFMQEPEGLWLLFGTYQRLESVLEPHHGGRLAAFDDADVTHPDVVQLLVRARRYHRCPTAAQQVAA